MARKLKWWERVIKMRLRKQVFRPTIWNDARCKLRQLMENFREKREDLHSIFVELEKDCDRVPRQELWNCRRLKGDWGKCTRLIQDMSKLQDESEERCRHDQKTSLSK